MANILNGLRPLFSGATFTPYINQKAKEYDAKVLEVLQYLGEDFVNKARDIRTYEDQTGNLRASIGYVILKDGKLLFDNFQEAQKGTDRITGIGKGKEYALELASGFPSGYVLIGVAGMNYAAAVESNNYDVITGSAPTDADFRSIFDAIEF